MSKYQTALYSIAGELYFDCGLDELKLLQELVDKQTPMKPVFNRLELSCGECGSCKIEDFEDELYCPSCGQRMDWEE